MRTAFRAYALLGTSPSDTLARLNRLLMKEGGELMATALYLLLDRDTGQVWYASAGHPPALVVARDSEPRYLEGGRSVPLGTTDIGYEQAETEIERGATVILYTDGLVERRDTSLDDRLAQLATVAGVAGGELGDVCDQILGGLLGGKRPSDDVAILALRPEPSTAGSLELRLPADPGSLAQLRQRMGRFLDAAGVGEQDRFEITLAVSEAAMNAIEHAYGPSEAEFDLSATIKGNQIHAEVRDSGRWRDRRSDDRGRGLAIIDALMEDVEVIAEPTGTTVRMRRPMGAGRPG
jgi:anti-sigma regulatory factor (Ser/Thr protein kinase)